MSPAASVVVILSLFGIVVISGLSLSGQCHPHHRVGQCFLSRDYVCPCLSVCTILLISFRQTLWLLWGLKGYAQRSTVQRENYLDNSRVHMPSACSKCDTRLRRDGTCSTTGCANFRTSRRGCALNSKKEAEPNVKNESSSATSNREPPGAKRQHSAVGEDSIEKGDPQCLVTVAASGGEETPLRNMLWGQFSSLLQEVDEVQAVEILAHALKAANKLEPQVDLAAATWAFAAGMVERPGCRIKVSVATCSPRDLCCVLNAIGASANDM
jgi:hypothetical protein